MMSEMTQLRNHLWSAGMTYQGACFGASTAERVLVGVHVVVPVLALLEVAGVELPLLRRGRPGGPAAARVCSSLEMCRKNFRMMVPSSASICSKALIWSYRFDQTFFGDDFVDRARRARSRSASG